LIADLSYLLLWAALACAAYAAVMALLSVGQQQPAWLSSAHRAALISWPLVTLSCLGLVYLLVTDHF
jgi:cytochrome c biogenesis factor